MIKVMGFEALRPFDECYGIGHGRAIINAVSRQELLDLVSSGVLVGRCYSVPEPSPLRALTIGHSSDLSPGAIECIDAAAQEIVTMVRAQEPMYSKTIFQRDAQAMLNYDQRVKDDYLRSATAIY